MGENKKVIDKRIYIPYGLEIEFEGVLFDEAKRVLSHKLDDKWVIGDDETLVNRGVEITSPVLDNTKENLVLLKKLANTLKHLNATFANSSLQINFSFPDSSTQNVIYLLKIFSIYQGVIYRFSCGIDGNARSSIYDYACPLGRLFKDKLSMNAIPENSYVRFINNKTFGLSLKTLSKSIKDSIKVIEVRTPNGTSEYKIWLNYIVFFSSYIKCILNKSYDKEYIDYLFRIMDFNSSIEDLIKIDERRASEFADLIYVSEEDKNNFYNQYYHKLVL